MTHFILLLGIFLGSTIFTFANKTDFLKLSQELLEAAQNKTNAKGIQDKLAEVSLETLASFLDTDAKRKVFWINIYNAYIQLILSEHPELFEDRGKFFGKKQVPIVRKKLSFDDIEHGIIRGSRWKIALGLIKNPLPGKFEKKLRVKKRDPRIHFALNCGAADCPPIAIYEPEKLEGQLDTISTRFLKKTSTYNNRESKVTVTPLFSWFRGDFGCKSGTRDILKKYKIIPKKSKPRIKYGNYDWSLSLANYTKL